MKQIKVLHYGLSDNKGGIENVVHSWFENKPENVIFDFVNDSDNPIAYEDEFIKGGSKIYHVENRYKHPFKRFNSFKENILLFESSLLGIGQNYLQLSCSEFAGK